MGIEKQWTTKDTKFHEVSIPCAKDGSEEQGDVVVLNPLF